MNSMRILVWDIPTRVFHWLLAASFAGAYVTAESESWRLVHVTLGYTFAGLILFRLLWGIIGTRHARFSDFAFGPRRVLAYLRGLLSRTPQHYIGHNPAGSWAIYAILVLGLGIGLSGYALYTGTWGDTGGEVFEELHEVLANALLVVVGLHIAGVLFSSALHRENLPRSMITGYKKGDPAQAIGGARAVTGVVLAGAVLAFWVNAYGVREALVGAPVDGAPGEQTLALEQDDDDDD